MSLNLSDVSETLWIPLFGKAIETKRKNGLIEDAFALEIAEKACRMEPSLNRWWTSLSRESQGLMIWRNNAIDQYVSDYIAKHPDGVVVNLGAGLCTRFQRFNNQQIKWVEIDLPPVKDAWLNFNSETSDHFFWTDNIFQEEWLKKIKAIRSENVLFIAEGLMMYFSKAQVKQIFENVNRHLGDSYFILEAYSKFALMRPHPDVWKTAARKFKNPWGIATGKDFESWLPSIKHVSDNYFLKNEKALRRVPFTHKIGSKIPIISKAGKIVYLHIT